MLTGETNEFLWLNRPASTFRQFLFLNRILANSDVASKKNLSVCFSHIYIFVNAIRAWNLFIENRMRRKLENNFIKVD